MLAKFSGVKSERTVSKFRKRKRKFCVLLTYFVKWVHEIWKFHVVVMQRRPRNVQKSAIVKTYCFFPVLLPSPASLLKLCIVAIRKFCYHGNVTSQVARYSFSGSLLPRFEHNYKLRRHKQGFEKTATTVVLDKDENLLWSGLQWHRSCHSNEMTPLPILLASVFFGTENYFSKIVCGSFFLT